MHGLVLKEEMTGWIRLGDDDERRPFGLSVRAFTTDVFRFDAPREFAGTVRLPGLLPETPVTGVLTLHWQGPHYVMAFALPGQGELELEGRKRYRLDRLRESLTTLPLVVRRNGQIVGEAELVYRDSLPGFLFTVLERVPAQYAFAPGARWADRLLPYVPVLVPDWREFADADEVKARLAFQMERLPGHVQPLITLSLALLDVLARWHCRRPVRRLSEGQCRALAARLERISGMHLLLTPLYTILLTAVFGSRRHREHQGQHLPEPPKQVEPERWMALHQTPSSVWGAEELEVDAVVIGSGAGGAAAAYELARLGHAVAIIEEGAYFKRQDFTGDRAEMMAKLYRDGGFSLALSNAGLWLPTGKTVGGTTTINSGTAMRPPAATVARWRRELGLNLDLEPYFSAVEAMLDVKPAPAKLLGGVERIIARGADGYGYTHHALPRAETGCDGQGYCILGCPVDAKRSTNVSYVPAAMQANAYLFSHYRVRDIRYEQGRAVGVVAELPGYGSTFDLRVRARVVVVAAGTLNTPALLRPFAGGNPHLGRHLTVHPAITLGARFDETVRQRMLVPQSYGVFDLPGAAFTLEGYTLNADTIPMAFAFFGDHLAEIMRDSRRFTNFAAMLNDATEGRVLNGPQGGVPWYWLDQASLRRVQEAAVVLAELLFAAGARDVYAPIRDFERMRSPDAIAALRAARLRATGIKLSAHHPLGSCRMAASPELGVLDANGRVFGSEGLYACDGAAISGPLGANPQVTIMANALRIARHIHEQELA